MRLLGVFLALYGLDSTFSSIGCSGVVLMISDSGCFDSMIFWTDSDLALFASFLSNFSLSSFYFFSILTYLFNSFCYLFYSSSSYFFCYLRRSLANFSCCFLRSLSSYSSCFISSLSCFSLSFSRRASSIFCCSALSSTRSGSTLLAAISYNSGFSRPPGKS
jgi:hypothetical protein